MSASMSSKPTDPDEPAADDAAADDADPDDAAADDADPHDAAVIPLQSGAEFIGV